MKIGFLFWCGALASKLFQKMETLLILHGWQSSKEKWQQVKVAFEKGGVEVIVPNLPGFKPETELNKPWNLDDYIEWLKNFSQDRKSFFLLGHSFGGRIAIKFAAKHPKRLKGLILVSAAGIKPKKTLWLFLISIIAKIGNKFSFLPFFSFFRKLFYKFLVRKKDYFEVKGTIKETFKKVVKEDLTPYLSKIQTPTLIIWGKNDKITPLKDALLMAEKIKNSKLEILENIGHTPHLENPQLLAQKIKTFVD
ncbi:MAG: alpha/beta hydrolase [Patescibacteria group bacterium]|nr:alpha/beta hydrolase [Patescibacteria group bacterium]